MELYHDTFLKRVGSMLGTVLKIDRLMPRGKFARIYVEVDSEKQLVSRIKAREHTYYVEYEGLHLI